MVWQGKKVELALFKWKPWRLSIISQWATSIDLPQVNDGLKVKAKQELTKMEFPESGFLALYWVSCVFSDYILDDPRSLDPGLSSSRLKGIVIPDVTSVLFDRVLAINKLEIGQRAMPPDIWDRSDLKYFASHRGYGTWEKGLTIEWVGGKRNWVEKKPFNNETRPEVLLHENHEIYKVLDEIRGRPRKLRQPVKRYKYSDKLAVRCAVLSRRAWSHLDIGKELGLPSNYPGTSYEQNNAVRNLIKRGNKLIGELLPAETFTIHTLFKE